MVENRSEVSKAIWVFFIILSGKVRTHFFHKSLAEGWRDPFSGMNPTVHPNDLFGFI